MTWKHWIQRLTSAVWGQGAAAGEDEIDEELLFHIRSAVDDRLARGMEFRQAWDESERQFGSLHGYAEQCRRARGVRLWKRLLPALGVAAMIFAIAWLNWQVIETRRELDAALHGERLAPSQKQPKPDVDIIVQDEADSNDRERERTASTNQQKPSSLAIEGQVAGDNGWPLADARVLVIVKTWPHDHYRQEAFVVSTDKDGRFRLTYAYPSGQQYAVQTAVLKEGYAFQSTYFLHEEHSSDPRMPLSFALQQSAPVKLSVRDEQGRPAAHVGVIPRGRQAADGERHSVYFQAGEQIVTNTDADGAINLVGYQAGDDAEIYVRWPGKDWESREFVIPETGEIVISPAAGEDDSNADHPRSST